MRKVEQLRRRIAGREEEMAEYAGLTQEAMRLRGNWSMAREAAADGAEEALALLLGDQRREAEFGARPLREDEMGPEAIEAIMTRMSAAMAAADAAINLCLLEERFLRHDLQHARRLQRDDLRRLERRLSEVSVAA